MSRATPVTRVWSQVLIAYETGENQSSESKTLPAFFVFEKLLPHLANLMGKIGVRALISRALALANAEVPALRAVQVNAEGVLERSDKIKAEFDPAEMAEGGVILLARLLGLLVSLIGENLTVQIVGEVWPELTPNNLNLEKGGKNEKEK